MRTTNEFLNAVKAKHGLTSDYKLAMALGVTEASIGGYRHGRSMLGDRTALRVAGLLDVDPAYVVACIHAERAGDDEVLRGVWLDLAAKYRRAEKALQPYLKAAAAFFLAVILSAFSGGPDGGAQAATPGSARPALASGFLPTVHYVKSAFAILAEPARWLMCLLLPSSLRPV